MIDCNSSPRPPHQHFKKWKGDIIVQGFQLAEQMHGVKIKKIAHGARRAIKMHSTIGDVAALCRDLRNGVRHYFGGHRKLQLCILQKIQIQIQVTNAIY